jgi:hypothetical protein
MKRAIVLALSVILALTMAAPTVLAQSDNGVAPGPSPDSGIFTVNPGDFPGTCDFPMLFEVSGKEKTITLPDGTLIITSPGLDVTVTNLDNLENQATFSITGSFHESTNETGQVTTLARGRSLLFDPVAGTVIASGNFSYVFNADGTLAQPLEGEGRLIDVCALLA